MIGLLPLKFTVFNSGRYIETLWRVCAWISHTRLDKHNIFHHDNAHPHYVIEQDMLWNDSNYELVLLYQSITTHEKVYMLKEFILKMMVKSKERYNHDSEAWFLTFSLRHATTTTPLACVCWEELETMFKYKIIIGKVINWAFIGYKTLVILLRNFEVI